MDKNYQKLIGKTKKEIIADLGFEFNHYPSDVWTYLVKTNWLGMKKILMIYFQDNIVTDIKMKKSFSFFDKH